MRLLFLLILLCVVPSALAVVTIDDVLLVVDRFGTSDSFADVNNDGVVDLFDLVLVARSLGEPAPHDSVVWRAHEPEGWTTIVDEGFLDFQEQIIGLTGGNVDFGTLDASTSEETVERNTIDDAPDPLRVRNTGNVLIAYDFRALETLWENEALGTEYFQFRDQTAASWNNISSTAQGVFTGLGIESERDIVKVPVLEPPRVKSSTV